jgi:hypothetical protein
VPVAYNAVFQEQFLAAELARAGLTLGPLPALCTLRLAQQTTPTPNHKLATLAWQAGIAMTQRAHRPVTCAPTKPLLGGRRRPGRPTADRARQAAPLRPLPPRPATTAPAAPTPHNTQLSPRPPPTRARVPRMCRYVGAGGYGRCMGPNSKRRAAAKPASRPAIGRDAEPVERLEPRRLVGLPRTDPFRAACLARSASTAGAPSWRSALRRLAPQSAAPAARSCCWYHGGDWRTVSRLAVGLLEQARSRGVSEDELVHDVLRRAGELGLDAWQSEALGSLFLDPMMVDDDLWINGQHRAQAMLDAGVRKTVMNHLRYL